MLSAGNQNEHLNLDKQNALWKKTLKECPWFAPFAQQAQLLVISDNGDLLFEVPSGSLLCSPRDNEFETYDIGPVDLVKRARNIGSKLLPDDL